VSPLRHNLRCSVIDGTFYMVMLGLAETFFPLFILDLYGAEVASGLIATVPLLLASVLQLLAPVLVKRLGSYKRVIVLTAVVQALACPLLAGIALAGHAPVWLTFVAATIYHCGAIVGGPPWTAMMSIIVPGPIRANFFARRLRTLQIGAVAAVVAGAALLDASPRIVGAAAGVIPALEGSTQRPTLPVYAVLFLLAGVARAVSALYLHRHVEPSGAAQRHTVLSARQLVARLRHDGRWRLIGALVLFWFCAMVGSPFWAAYVRGPAALSFLEWAGLIVLWFLGRAVAVSVVGEAVSRYGKRRVLIGAAFFMAPIPALWAMSTQPLWLAIAQLLAGMSIAVWDLSTFLVTMETFNEEERTSLLGKYGLLQWGASAAGSSVGGALLAHFGAARAAFAIVFVTSAVLRLVTALTLARTHRSGLPSAGKAGAPQATAPPAR
jgi:MFS family permease